MPKEIIYDSAGMYDAVVGWSPDQYVQVGIQTHSGRTLAETLGAGDNPAQFTGLWGTFDRDGLNRLIKMLRHAREAAYGKDE